MIKIATMVGAPDLQKPALAVYQGDLAAAMAKVARLGYDGVELMTLDPWTIDGPSLQHCLGDNGLALAGLCTGHLFREERLGLVGPDEQTCRRTMDRIKRFIDYAATYCEAGTIINLGRVRGPGYPDDRAGTLARAADAFAELADYGQPNGIRLVLEPNNTQAGSFINTTQEGLAMLRRVNRPNFGLMLDTYHMNIEEVHICDGFREAAADLWFVHLADNNRRWPGSAHLEFDKIVAVLDEIGYSGFASLEIMPWPDGDTAARCAIESLRRFIPKAS